MCIRVSGSGSLFVAAGVISLLSAIPLPGVAQSPPTAGELLRREQELERLRDIPQTIPQPKEAPRRAQPSGPGGPAIVIKGFNVVGEVKSVSRITIDAILSEYIGKSLNFSDLNGITERITKLYRDLGFFLARAVLPTQDVTDGVITIQILEAPVDPKNGILFKGDSIRLNQGFARSVVEAAIGQPGSAIEEGKLERGTLNLNDNPGFATSVLAEPGETEGTTRLVFESVEGPLVVGSVVVDNFGSRYTGDWRYTGNANINNPTRYGDQIQVTYTGVPSGDFALGRLGYAFPIGTSGLRGSVSYTDLSFGVGKELASLNAKGNAQNATAGVKYPFYRTQLTSIHGTMNYDWKALKNESGGSVQSDKRIDLGTAGLSLERADQFLGGGFTQIGVTHAWGKLDLSRISDSLTDDQNNGYYTNGNFQKTTYQIVRIQRGTKQLSFQGMLSGQLANKNLDSAEKFSLGGPAGVKGYPGGEGSGDEGHKLNLEARYTALSETKYGAVLLQAFYDRGHIKKYKDLSTISTAALPTNNAYNLASWGLGVNVVSAGKHDVKVGWSHAIGDNLGKTTDGNYSDGRASRSRFWVFLSKEF